MKALRIPSASIGLLMAAAGWVLAQQGAEEENYKESRSRSFYPHHIPLYDAQDRLIDPDDPNAGPYSPRGTCKKCHDYKVIETGYHFNAALKGDPGRQGEPWILTDLQTGSQIPVSYRRWPGTFAPDEIGLTRFRTIAEFVRHMPGSEVGEAYAVHVPATGDAAETAPQAPAEPDVARWKAAGALEIDCLMCHSGSRTYSPEAWAKQVAEFNFAWAATAALGLAKIEGTVRELPADFDPAAAPADPAAGGPRLPRVTYDRSRFDPEKKVYLDILRRPSSNSCYACHSVMLVGTDASERWTRDDDVHLAAGLSCSDCHRNGLSHHIVRGYEGEKNPSGLPVTTLSCRGCHLGEEGSHEHAAMGGRLGAPRPQHKGLPPLHLEKLSCTACHSGPVPGPRPANAQTSMAHALGMAAQTRGDKDLPEIVEPVFQVDAEGVIHPYRMTWPAYWGWLDGDEITPIDPVEAFRTLRRALRIRQDFRAELATAALGDDEKTALLGAELAGKPEVELPGEAAAKLAAALRAKSATAFREKLGTGLQALAKTRADAAPVYVSAGKVYRLDAAGQKVEVIAGHPAAAAYAWPLAHDVRPARQSLGVFGCKECHSSRSPLFYGTVTALGPAADDAPLQTRMFELMKLNPTLLAAWEQSFRVRTAFKWAGFAALGATALVLILCLMLGVNGLLNLIRRKR